jgi:hypothetical protein
MAVTITNINPATLEIQNYSNQDINLIPLEEISSQFNPSDNYVEYTIISANGSYQVTEQNFFDYKIINNYSPVNTSLVYNIDINPEDNLISRGFTNGEYNVIYNFLNNELNSNSDNRAFYIKEISPDRTEIKIASNILSNSELEASYNAFKSKLDDTSYFQDFYLNFGSNSLIIANNVLIDNTKAQYEILINLYEALPNQFRTKDTLWIVTQVADPLAFNVQFSPEVIVPLIVNPTIKGPNFDLPLKDRINNSSNYINYEELLTTGLASSQQQILSYLQDKSISIGVDYSDFADFIHFSSAQSRVENFYYKIQLIEQYNADITTLQLTTSSSVSESVAVLQSKIDNITTNFDGYEYWLYYESGSTTYPKGTSTPPYDLLYSGDTTVVTWYNDLIDSASLFDQNNQDYLVNTIPDYLRDDSQNQPYITFINMIGQHYDNIWLYYKDVTNRYNGDNRLEFGISKDLVADALRSFGLKIYQNNFSTNDLYNAFTGYNIVPSASFSSSIDGNVYVTGSYIVEYPEEGYFLDDVIYHLGDPTELITNYVTASQEALFEPIDDVNKEIYKRLYHNLPLLLKQKGTVAGLRNLINVYGIPDTILKISEFGGRDKDTSTYDYFDQQYNYKLDIPQGSYVETVWALNSKWPTSSYNGGVGIPPAPETVQFRFKNIDLLNNPPYSQSIWKADDSGGESISLVLTYTGSAYASASYSGSSVDPYYQYAKLDFIPSSNYPAESASLYLPFYDNNWWSVMITWDDTNNFTLYAGNKLQYDGYDGNQIGFLASASVTSSGNNWGNGEVDSSYFGDRNNILPTLYSYFTGSFQEIRYYTRPLGVNSFKDFIMNPNSVDTVGENTYADYLAFRGSLGGELYTGSTSIHPKISGSWITTQSFNSNSDFSLVNDYSFSTNIETRFLNSPIAGLRNRVTDKIQIVSQSLPPINLAYTQSGNTLSQYISIQQQYISSGSETPDVNALEVAFSPTNEVDDDIIASLGYFNIGEYIGDPRQINTSATSYPDLDALAVDYFKKYSDNYDLVDYIRLIKFFDNSLFKLIKDFVPARTNLRSGVVVKQHLLERNKYPQPQMAWEDITYSGSIDTAFFSGSTGGTFNEFNILVNDVNVSTSFVESVVDSTALTNPFIGAIQSFDDRYFEWVPETGKLISNIHASVITYISASHFNIAGIRARFVKNTDSNIYSSFTTADNDLFRTSSFTEIFPGDEIYMLISSSGAVTDFTASFGVYDITPFSPQVWYEFELGPTGSTYLLREDQREFYNGELPGTIIEASNGELNEANVFKYPSTLEINYDIVFYKSNITPLNNFLNLNTSPNQGEIYLWYDTGSTTQVSNPGSFTGVIR